MAKRAEGMIYCLVLIACFLYSQSIGSSLHSLPVRRMSVVDDVIIPLTVVINSENTKVLFAEVDNDFTDIFLSFLTLPLGKILGLFNKHYGEEAPVIGSLSTLYNSLESLDDVYFWTSEGKQMLLNPRSNFSDDCNNLKFNLDDSLPTKYFTCGTWHCSRTTDKQYNRQFYSNRIIGLYYDSMRCKCGELMSEEICFEKSNTVLGDEEGVFTRSTSNFIASDDMQIGPNALGLIQNLRNISIADIQGTTTMTIDVRANEIMDLLKGVLLSQTPLTDFVRHKTPMNNVIEKCKPNTTLHIEQKEENSRKIVVKVVLHTSTNKFLFIQAEDDFIDFLYSLLIIPLGGVAHILGGSTCLGSVDNLYRSVANFDGKHLKTKDMKNRLLEPQLPCSYLSECQILPITELLTKVYSHSSCYVGAKEYVSLHAPEGIPLSTIIDPKGKECYIRRPGIFIVRDDLTVTPLSAISAISLLNEMRVPLFDVEEVDMEIGVNEALGILKESLASTSVFTNVLIKPILNRQPKEENMFRRGIMI